MSRFSPSVLPTAANPFVTALNEGFDTYMQARAQKRANALADEAAAQRRQAAADTHTGALTAQYEAGLRPGVAPIEDAGAGDLAPAPDTSFRLPSTPDYARALAGGTTSPAPRTAFSAPTSSDFAAMLAGHPSQPTAAAPAVQPAAQPPRTGVWSGAFDASTGTFGGQPPSPTALALGQAAQRSVQSGPLGRRFVQVDPGHYIDTAATPEARARNAVLQTQNFTTERDAARAKAAADLKTQEESATTARDTAKAQTERAKVIAKARADQAILAGYYPDDPLATAKYDPENPPDFAAALAHRRDVDKIKAQAALEDKRLAAAENRDTATGTVLPGAEGQPPQLVITHGDKKHPIATTIAVPGVTKPTAGDAIATMAIPQLARANSAIQTMNVVEPKLRQIEGLIQSGKVSYNGWDQFVRSYNDAAQHANGDPHLVNMATLAVAQEHLNKANPQLAEYVKLLQTWALEDSNMQQRASDFRTRLDELVSSIGPGAQPGLIANVQESRSTRLKGYNEVLPVIQGKLRSATSGRGGATVAPQSPGPITPGDKGGDIDLGATDGRSKAAQWQRANPRQAGESDSSYAARFSKATGIPITP